MAKFTNEAFSEIRNVSGLSISPNGKNIAYGVSGQCVDDDRNLSYIWVYNTESGNSRQLTFTGNEGGAAWMDDETLVFSAVRDEKDRKQIQEKSPLTVFYALSLNGGEARELFRIPVSGAQVESIDGDRWMVYGTFDSSVASDGEQKLYRVYDEYPYHADGRGYVNKKRARLYVFTASDGSLVPITEPLFQTNQTINQRVRPLLSRDKKHIYYWGEVVTGSTPWASDVYAYDVEEKTSRKLFDNDDYLLMDCVEFGDRVYFMGFAKDDLGPQDIISVSREGGDYRVELMPDYSLERMVPMGDSIWLIYGRHDKSDIYRWVPGSDPTFLCTPEYVIEGPLVRANDQVFYPGRRPLETRQLVKMCDGSCSAVTDVSRGLADKYSLSPSQPVSFVNRDGYTVCGWVLAPHGYEPGTKYPAILSIHGGPQGSYSNLLYPTMQRYAAEGYFVLFCNPRGSSNYGREFMELQGKFGTIDFEDLMAFTDHVLSLYPDIDGDRMGVTGGSYGGYMTNWVIGHTDRFKAAAPQRSISNWISFYGCTDLSWFVEWGQEGTPWRNADKLWWHSPLKYADNIKTPTLFLQNERDYRCPVEQAEQMLTALIDRGVPARMVLFHNASHSSMSPKQQRINDDEVIAWFDRYLK